ncbi:MAG: hypothetical protein AAFQ57_05025, partial [Cyanobacteria bacterium J06626_14]
VGFGGSTVIVNCKDSWALAPDYKYLCFSRIAREYARAVSRNGCTQSCCRAYSSSGFYNYQVMRQFEE